VRKKGSDPKRVAIIPYTGLANGWGTNDPTSESSGWINAVDPKTCYHGLASHVAHAHVRGQHAHVR
jgi:hypothetical protein